jgi:hypothetical protein
VINIQPVAAPYPNKVLDPQFQQFYLSQNVVLTNVILYYYYTYRWEVHLLLFYITILSGCELAVGKAVATRGVIEARAASVAAAFLSACLVAGEDAFVARVLICAAQVPAVADVCPNGGHLCMMHESHIVN